MSDDGFPGDSPDVVTNMVNCSFCEDFGRVARLQHRELSGVYRCSDRGARPSGAQRYDSQAIIVPIMSAARATIAQAGAASPLDSVSINQSRLTNLGPKARYNPR